MLRLTAFADRTDLAAAIAFTHTSRAPHPRMCNALSIINKAIQTYREAPAEKRPEGVCAMTEQHRGSEGMKSDRVSGVVTPKGEWKPDHYDRPVGVEPTVAQSKRCGLAERRMETVRRWRGCRCPCPGQRCGLAEGRMETRYRASSPTFCRPEGASSVVQSRQRANENLTTTLPLILMMKRTAPPFSLTGLSVNAPLGPTTRVETMPSMGSSTSTVSGAISPKNAGQFGY